MTTSCISYLHDSPNLQVYALNNKSQGLKTLEHVSSQIFFLLKMEIPPALQSALIPLVMLLTYEKIPEYQISGKIYSEHRTKRNNNMYFIIQKGK